MASGMRRKQPNNGGSTNNSSNNGQPKMGMGQLHEWLERAKYEVDVDPYRGLQELLDNDRGAETTSHSPWRLDCTPGLAGTTRTTTASATTAVAVNTNTSNTATTMKVISMVADNSTSRCTEEPPPPPPQQKENNVAVNEGDEKNHKPLSATTTTSPEDEDGPHSAINKKRYDTMKLFEDTDDEDGLDFKENPSIGGGGKSGGAPLGGNATGGTTGGGSITSTSHHQPVEDEDATVALVVSATRCKCPSLIGWTRPLAKKRQQQRNKTKKEQPPDAALLCVVGRRPAIDALNYRCQCDYNPFCLLSLGGALQDALLPKPDRRQSPAMSDDTDDDEVNVLEDWDNPNAEEYSDTTRDVYKSVRRSSLVNVESIRDYLYQMVENVDDVIAKLQVQHSMLYFVNPLAKRSMTNRRPVKIPLAVPPGIENLGATCYLNTQLQCLAQNIVFLRGILSWRCAAEDRMSQVLKIFQNLLTQMRFGPYDTVNTLSFSDALGLDHHEQQDPNEFSRLFLERMHESFQSTDADLANLLPMLFQGESSFETICQKCDTKSVRKEHFMDLNLPIVDGGQKKTVATTVSRLWDFAKPKQKCVDLNECLEEYGHAEHLDGDNQYYCSHCGSKQNAIRRHNLTSLPNVLNLQLIRYVYNRVTLMKTKVTKAVALPRTLNVGERKYRLCAIMSHQGSSAYSGHYTAEAMDWTSGQWYSFNDEKVMPLCNGPKSSYGDGKDQDNCEGSADAYNLYYVHEGFLNQSVLDVLRAPFNKFPLVGTIAIERSAFFSRLSEMCLADAKVTQQLKHRRTQIVNHFSSPDVQSLFSAPTKDDLVWVDAAFLIRFFSCQDQLYDLLTLDDCFDPYFFLCEHKKLHPRVARKGKFLPKAIVAFIVKVLDQEKRELFSDRGNCATAMAQNLLSVTNVVCPDCSARYREHLSSKLQHVGNVLKLRDALEHRHLSSSSPVGSGDRIGSNDEHLFVIFRKFVTWFRNTVDEFAKHSAKEIGNTQRVVCEQRLVSCAAENAAEGLDGLDLTRFLIPSGADENINRNVNGKHGRCKSIRKQSYYLIPARLWEQIKALFPLAIELTYKNKPESDKPNFDDVDSFSCIECSQVPSVDERGSPGDISTLKPSLQTERPKPIRHKEVEIVEPPGTVFELRVLEAIAGSDSDKWMDDLAILHGSDNKKDQDSGSDTYLRRSTRKRKLRFPIGCFRDEDSCKVDFSRNVAALRLTLVEKCCAGSTFQPNHTLCLVISSYSMTSYNNDGAFTKENTKIEILNYARNAENLLFICEQSDCKPGTDGFDPAGLLLIRVAEREPTMAGVSDEEIYDHFISLAHGEVGNMAKKKKTAQVERGFNGTFLLNGIVEENKDTMSTTTPDQSCRKQNSPIKQSLIEPTAHCDKINEMIDSPEMTEDMKESSMFSKEPVTPAITGKNVPEGDDVKAGEGDECKRIEETTTRSSSTSPSQQLFEMVHHRTDSRSTRPVSNGGRRSDDATKALVDFIVHALRQNPDIKDEQDQSLVVLVAEHTLQSCPMIEDKTKLTEKAYAVYLEFTGTS